MRNSGKNGCAPQTEMVPYANDQTWLSTKLDYKAIK